MVVSSSCGTSNNVLNDVLLDRVRNASTPVAVCSDVSDCSKWLQFTYFSLSSTDATSTYAFPDFQGAI